MNREAKRVNGLCYDCLEPVSGFRTRCLKHLTNNTKRNKSAAYRKKHKIAERKRRKKSKSKVWPSHSPEYLQEVRLLVINMLGGPECVQCGCNSLEILEINHINGGGHKERKQQSTLNFYRKILRTDYPDTKYNILCKVCNVLYYVELVFGIKGSVRWS